MLNWFRNGKPKLRADKSGNVVGWSQMIWHLGAQISPSWKTRQHGGFTREQVYPCNEGYPETITLGPTQGGWPILFELVLADGSRSRGSVRHDHLIDDQPSWCPIEGPYRGQFISYYFVAAWRSL